MITNSSTHRRRDTPAATSGPRLIATGLGLAAIALFLAPPGSPARASTGPDLRVVMAADVNPVALGADVTYTVLVTNVGDTATANSVLADRVADIPLVVGNGLVPNFALAGGALIRQASSSIGGAAGPACSISSGPPPLDQPSAVAKPPLLYRFASCPLGSLAPAASATVTIVVQADRFLPNVHPPTPFVNSATATSDGTDPTPQDDTAAVVEQVTNPCNGFVTPPPCIPV